MKKWLLLTSLVVFILSVSASNKEEGLEYLLFEEIPAVTIASKTEESITGSSGTVYVISEQDIKNYGWRDLQEILKAIPNIDIMWQYNWLNGGQRGFTGNFSGTLLLIDGREVQNLLASEAFMTNDFPAHRIKRVEILQGPNSTLYGGNATQGVINIITKFGDKGDKDLNAAEVIIGEVGTEMIAGVFKKIAPDKTWEIGFSGSTFKTDQNWDELAEFAADDNLFSRDMEKDPLRYHGTENFRNHAQTWTADMYARYKNFYVGYDFFKQINTSGLEYVKYDYNRNEPRRGYRQAYVGWKQEFSENFSFFIEYQNVDEDENWLVDQLMNPETATSYADIDLRNRGESFESTTRDRIISQLNYTLNDTHNFVVGYDWWKLNIDHLRVQVGAIYPDSDKISSGWPVDKEETNKHSIFLQDTITLLPEMLKLTLGIRYNEQDYTNNSWLPRASLVYQPTKESAIKVTYGKAFRPPNIFEFLGSINDSLDSQEMEMYELNYTQNANFGDLTVSNIAAVYTMEASNLYSKVWVGGGETQLAGWQTVVGGEFKVTGFEDMLRLGYKNLSGFVGFRWIDPDETTVAGTGIEADVPITKIKTGLNYKFTDWLTASIFVDHWSKVKTEANKYLASGTEVYEVDPWTTVDLNINVGEFNLDEMYAMFSLYVENLLDEEYYHANVRGTSPVQFLQPPRTLRAKLSLRY